MCNYHTYAGAPMQGSRWANRRHGGWGNQFRSMPVNIKEMDDHFEISLYAPGLQKANLQVTVKDDLLFITYKNPDEPGDEKTAFTRREYRINDFERSFLLKQKVAVEKISATYQEGILNIILPKNPETNKPAQEVPIS